MRSGLANSATGTPCQSTLRAAQDFGLVFAKKRFSRDDERIKNHLDRVVRGSIQETLNALLEAEADRLCNAQRYEHSNTARPVRMHARASMSASCRPRLARCG